MTGPKLLIYGFDGLDPFNINKFLVDLPVLRKMLPGAMHGVVSSLYFSFDVWTSYLTGDPPEVHGIESQRMVLNNLAISRLSIRSTQVLWDVVNKHGLSIGFIETPMLYPAPEINGFVWAGPPKPLEEDLIFFPKSLRDYVYKYPFQDFCFPKSLSDLGIDLPFEEIPDEVISSIACDRQYLEPSLNSLIHYLDWLHKTTAEIFHDYPVDILFIYVIQTDFFSHVASHPSGIPLLLEAYQAVDRYIGKACDDFHPEQILVISDHGIKPMESGRQVELHGYVQLAENGCLFSGEHSDQAFYLLHGSPNFKGCKKDIVYTDVFNLILKVLEIRQV